MKITVKPEPVTPPPTYYIIELDPVEALYIAQFGLTSSSSTMRELTLKLRTEISFRTGRTSFNPTD